MPPVKTHTWSRADDPDWIPVWHSDKYEPFINPRDKPVRREDEEALNKIARTALARSRK